MSKAKIRHRSPWLCGEDSTAIASVGLARKHELNVVGKFRVLEGPCNPTGNHATTTNNNNCSSGNRGASSKKPKEKKGSLLSLLSTKATTTWVLPKGFGSARKATACSGSGGEGWVSKESEGEAEEDKCAIEQKDENEAQKSKEVSFKLGLGAGLIFLYAKIATEVNKMMELKAEMEIFLKEIKGAIPKSDLISHLESTNNICITSQVSLEVQSAADSISPEDGQFSHHKQHSLGLDESSDKHTSLANAESQTMEQLEAELESELERLQLNLECDGSETSRFEFEAVGDGGDNSRTDGESHEGDDLQEGNMNPLSFMYENGVCPRELERRLYELLDMRQKERITKLESALQTANRTLHEKEMEIQWWQNQEKI